ncbi:putative ribonuclease H-like domain-containing protein [Tanacetum coccineum]
MLCQSLHSDDVEDFWRTQDEWIVSSWKLYPKSSVHVLDLTNGKTVYMFVDKFYPIRATLLERMLRHRLTVPPSYCRDVVVAGNIIQTVQAGLRQAYESIASAPIACTARQMVFSSPWLTAKKESGSPLQTALVCNSNPLMVASSCVYLMLLFWDIASTVSAACIVAAGYIVSAGICDAAEMFVPADYVPAGHNPCLQYLAVTFTYSNPNPSASPSFTQDDTSESFIPEPTQPMPTFTQTAFSQPAVNYQQVQPNESIFSQHVVHFQQTQPTQTNQTGEQYPQNPNDKEMFVFADYVPAGVMNYSYILELSHEDRKHAIGTKWILKNKRDARGIVVRNKARLVAQGHRQEEGIDYDEVFAPVARIEAIRLFLAFASYMGFLVYQLDVKSAFLYGEIEEEVYVTQPKGFEDPYFPKHVYRVVKALYGLHQAPRAWYARLSAFLLQHNYRRGTIDKTLFIKKDSRDILLVQVYVDDIIFGSTNKAWCAEFEVLMKGEFEMSAMGEMSFFLGLQVKQLPDGIFISQDKYVKDMLTKFDMESVRTATTPYEAAKTKLKDESDPPVNVHLYRSMIGSLMYLTASRPDIMFAVSACSRHQVTPLTSHLNAVKKIFKYLKGQPKLGLWYPKDSPFQLEAYSDSDYAGSHGDRKSTTGGCQFLGRRLISWQCKKQTIVATSSTEAEYVAAASCCAQVLWIQNQLLDYGFNFMNTKIFIDNQSTICIVKNPVFHQRTKHIEIRHHFIRDANEKNLIQVLKIHTDDNVADLLTKAFDGPRFEYLVVHIGMVDMVFCGILFSCDCRVCVPAVCMVSAVGCLFLLAAYIHAAGVVYAANTSTYAAELFDIAGWLVSATSHLVSAGSLQSCWCNNVSAA